MSERQTNGRFWKGLGAMGATALACATMLVGCGGGGAQAPEATGDAGQAAAGASGLEHAGDVLAKWSVDGASGEVLGGEVTNMSDAEGKEVPPSADEIVERARIEALSAAGAKDGVSASDEEVTEYVTKTMGYGDLASMAAVYGCDEETAKAVARDSIVASKWLASKAGTQAGSTEADRPNPPEAPSVEATESAEEFEKKFEEANKTAKPEYLEYVKSVAGDGWKELVANPDTGATYEEAMKAYDAAYENWSGKRWEARTGEDAVANELLRGGHVELMTMSR